MPTAATSLKRPAPSPLGATLTDVVCWSRMQAEAGQGLEAILRRKEIERLAGNGIFCWGVGNAPSRSIGPLASCAMNVDVVFSVMKSRPKAIDVSPKDVVVWTSFFDHQGREYPLPDNCLVTSRAETASGRKSVHYALMCRSDEAITLGDYGTFDPSAYRNASETAGPVGASQVTALLRRVAREQDESGYRINVKAKLVHGYWVRLGGALPLNMKKRSLFDRLLGEVRTLTSSTWTEFVKELRAGAPEMEIQPNLI